MNQNMPESSGIHIAAIKSEKPMPVIRDKRHVETCAKVTKDNVKVGKAENLFNRRKNYWNDFDQDNVIFTPIALLAKTDLVVAEGVVMNELAQYRMISPKGGKLEWLEGISFEEVREIVVTTLEKSDIDVTFLSR